MNYIGTLAESLGIEANTLLLALKNNCLLLYKTEEIPNAFPIDKGIPLPRKDKRCGQALKYPWPAMKIGDSTFVKGASSGAMSGTANEWCRVNAPKKHFIARKENDGVRVWRDK